MAEPALSDAWFEAKPMVLLIGQYSVGKTSFINYLLGRGFAGSRVGPEMTTDRFVAVMYGDAEKTTPGNALTSQPDTPFHSLKKYGTNFLNRLEAAALPSPILKRVTLVDSPGVLSGEKQRDRGYDYNGVVTWFAQHSDRILLLFDAYKLDLSDEFKDVMKLIQAYDKKVRVVLNKADGVSPQDLMRVYGALMWNVGGVIPSAEVPRVYIGSFWDRPWQNTGMLDLMEAEENDLIEDLVTMPQNNVMNKINEIARRARVVEAHTHLLAHLRAKVVAKWYGKREEQARLCTPEGLLAAYEQVQREHDLSRGDFPLPSRMASVLRAYDFTDFYKPSVERSKKLKALRELTECDIPELITRLHSVQQRRQASVASKASIVEGFRPLRNVRPPPPEHLFEKKLERQAGVAQPSVQTEPVQAEEPSVEGISPPPQQLPPGGWGAPGMTAPPSPAQHGLGAAAAGEAPRAGFGQAPGLASPGLSSSPAGLANSGLASGLLGAFRSAKDALASAIADEEPPAGQHGFPPQAGFGQGLAYPPQQAHPACTSGVATRTKACSLGFGGDGAAEQRHDAALAAHAPPPDLDGRWALDVASGVGMPSGAEPSHAESHAAPRAPLPAAGASEPEPQAAPEEAHAAAEVARWRGAC
ncbi:hypothetical protein EMIHUDRAFT_456074 [Emiliania huxleyi CCMP1516]|uniref:Dynamin-type G domain-containing protein n=2 Tax=Emiliania huxleyi TaxID=2903 RepID=A0A0D3K9Q7_EMIH1|nr:hypothetical protein EMIHUDRAFT_456074 [Emiliania huxleyi CCMP1516]EOD32492.1 hypothetical protein EMIHUDRAFT_456074 [Emiliania huxleyi CCMP1516]|eukprot:XP_005784921.1 hypothetical protein EMIHUDRAFT_456074 [Emiliania huxleyi CCMP1516]